MSEVLQWGRVSFERGRWGTGWHSLRGNDASMGPRSYERGRDQSAGRHGWTERRASTGPRSFERGRLAKPDGILSETRFNGAAFLTNAEGRYKMRSSGT